MKLLNGFGRALTAFCLLGAATLLPGSLTPITAAENNGVNKAQESTNQEAEKLLADLGYWITKVDDKKDASTFHAVAAFQKVEGRKRTGVLNQAELRAMRGAARPQAKFGGAAHVEVDLTRQVVFLVGENGGVTNILPTSTGNDKKYLSQGKSQTARTPRGEFKITRQIAGTRHAPLGKMYYPNYFLSGWAIHGSNSIPFQPASHGCVRIPNFAAIAFSRMVAVEMPVFVYD